MTDHLDPEPFCFDGQPLHYHLKETPVNREPLVTVASITALVGALIALLVSFGVKLTGDQQTAILAVTTVVAPLLVAAIARRKVTPVE